MESFLQDCGFAARQLRKTPGFTFTSIVTLAFGIGATAAIFSIVEGVLLRPLPFKDPTSLVVLGDVLQGVNQEPGAPGVTAPGALAYMRYTHAFSSLGAYRASSYEFSNLGNPAQIDAARVTAGVIPTLGVSPILGRIFTQQEEVSGEPVVVLSYQAWRNRFNADTQVIHRKILLDRKPYEVIGVMPREFEFPLVPGYLNRCELWLPMNFTAAELLQGAGNWGYYLVGRLRPGVTVAQAEQDAIPAAHEIMRSFPPALSKRRIRPVVMRLDEATVAVARRLVNTLFVAVVVVLLIACANVAGLLLVRISGRRREISLRIALGASRTAVLRLPLFESMLISACGGLLGLGLAALALHVGVSFLPETLPRISSITLDWGVVALTLGAALFTGLLCGLIPGLAIARLEVGEALKGGGRSATTGGGHIRLRSGLVIAEIAVALVLLVASGLLLRSFQRTSTAELGFQVDHTLTASYSLPRHQYSKQAEVDTFNLTLLARLEQLPGVQAVGITSLLPAAGTTYLATFTPEGYIAEKHGTLNVAWPPEVMGNYFNAQGIPILRGRDFTPADRVPGAQLVIIVNRSLAEHYWPGQNVIGKRLHRGPAEAVLPWLTIVGEIQGVKQAADEIPHQEIYSLAEQSKAIIGSFAAPDMLTGTGGSIVVRAALPAERLASSLLAIVRSIDPRLPLTNIESMDRVVSEGQAPRRFNTVLITVFAIVAVLLALIGIYSVIAFATAMRTQEIAIRLALGSQPSAAMRLILAAGTRLGVAGCAFGIIAALFATRMLRSFLFEVDALDPVVLVLAMAFILLLSLTASVIPALRAASIEPAAALRSE